MFILFVFFFSSALYNIFFSPQFHTIVKDSEFMYTRPIKIYTQRILLSDHKLWFIDLLQTYLAISKKKKNPKMPSPNHLKIQPQEFFCKEPSLTRCFFFPFILPIYKIQSKFNSNLHIKKKVGLTYTRFIPKGNLISTLCDIERMKKKLN